MPEFLERDEYIESIHKAKFKKLPSNYKKLTADEIAAINKDPWTAPFMPKQEKGTRASCALPYELYADGKLSSDKKTFEILLSAGRKVFGDNSAGSPFNVYAAGIYRQQSVQTWAYAVEKGQQLTDKWQLADFENSQYHLCVYGPNGFFREFSGTADDPEVAITCVYETSLQNPKQLSGNVILRFNNTGKRSYVFEITDNAYKMPAQSITVNTAPGKAKQAVTIQLSKSFGWYDFSVKIKGNNSFEKRYAGHVETGKAGKTDPFMGRVV
jgi:phospholipase C